MISVIEIAIKWKETNTGDTEIRTEEDLLEYACAQVESNAQFDHVDLRIVSAGFKF